MIWIIGEYAERIDNADELLESFLEGFQDENTQVKLYPNIKLNGNFKEIPFVDTMIKSGKITTDIYPKLTYFMQFWQ